MERENIIHYTGQVRTESFNGHKRKPRFLAGDAVNFCQEVLLYCSECEVQYLQNSRSKNFVNGLFYWGFVGYPQTRILTQTNQGTRILNAYIHLAFYARISTEHNGGLCMRV
jgi:hypothetical protein